MDDFAPARDISWQGDIGVVNYGNQNMVVMFYNKPLLNPAKSSAAGRPFFEDKVFVRIHPPGERLNIVDREATDVEKRRYPMQWRQFVDQREQIPEGTPIDMLYPEKPSIGATLRASGVHTIEMCAELSANAIENIGMGAQTYVNAAQTYLSAANKGVKATEFRKTVEDQEQKIRLLTRQIDDLKQELANKSSNPQDMNQMLAAMAQLMGRPQHLPNTNFDPALAQLNATHGSSTVPKPVRTRSRARAS